MKNTYIYNLLQQSLNTIGVEVGEHLSINLEKPKNTDNGDISSNIAFLLSKKLKKAPIQIANEIVQNLNLDKELIADINVAMPGFINFKFTPKYYQNKLNDVINIGLEYGSSEIGKDKKVNVEYVSANPTGLLHLGHGRNAIVGDIISSLYKWCGFDVTREYYFNNAGNQMNNLGKSVYARYMQQVEDKDFPLPEDAYHGEYVITIASLLKEKYANQLKEYNEENLKICRKFAEEWCFNAIKQTLNNLKIEHDIFFNEDTLYTDGKITEVINEFKAKGLAYEKDGALWLKLSEMGLEEDRVIVKSSGEPTYRLPDIAYHREKLNRDYDLIIDVFGSDHIATVPDVLAGIKALGYDVSKVKVLIHQFITLTENGNQVKMSKRTGKSYTLDDLIEEVGSDVVRFFLIMRSLNTHLEFDLALAREQSEKNPVFYLQYAHARIASIIEKVSLENIDINNINYDLNNLKEAEELNLIKFILEFPEIVENSCLKCEPQVLTEYLKELAAAFHQFYHNCRIMGSTNEVRNARLILAQTTKVVLNNGLKILGVTAPDKM
ncbi:MAG TPA: arginine--tRNA ligase [Candidatus Kapabacteria bacterium]|nr:arginine--tRNA ligase [Candidatus Kapabacteria bacterium]